MTSLARHDRERRLAVAFFGGALYVVTGVRVGDAMRVGRGGEGRRRIHGVVVGMRGLLDYLSRIPKRKRVRQAGSVVVVWTRLQADKLFFHRLKLFEALEVLSPEVVQVTGSGACLVFSAGFFECAVGHLGVAASAVGEQPSRPFVEGLDADGCEFQAGMGWDYQIDVLVVRSRHPHADTTVFY